MAGTNAIRDVIAAALVSGTLTAFSNANATIGVGDSTTAFAANQTDLQAASNKLRKAMDSGYPQVATNVVTFRATFGTSEANWTWQEWGVFNAASGGTMLSRKVELLTTKTSALSVQITSTITVTIS